MQIYFKKGHENQDYLTEPAIHLSLRKRGL
jgi:hypothetical protein